MFPLVCDIIELLLTERPEVQHALKSKIKRRVQKTALEAGVCERNLMYSGLSSGLYYGFTTIRKWIYSNSS